MNGRVALAQKVTERAEEQIRAALAELTAEGAARERNGHGVYTSLRGTLYALEAARRLLAQAQEALWGVATEWPGPADEYEEPE